MKFLREQDVVKCSVELQNGCIPMQGRGDLTSLVGRMWVRTQEYGLLAVIKRNFPPELRQQRGWEYTP